METGDPLGLIGQVLDGQFRVDKYVGEGGFSRVYKGVAVGIGEPIAIKCLKLPHAIGSAVIDTFLRHFKDESRIHYKLSQGNLHIVRCIGSGTTIAPSTSALVPYTVLEWLDGTSLADEFTNRQERGLGGRPLVHVVRMLDTGVDAVAYAHSQGVVHRDLNPGNLFLAETPAGTKLKVLDFGVAKILADSSLATAESVQTMGNMRMFAPAYGAPEQFDESVGKIGPWTDVYALALVTMQAVRDRAVIEGEHLGEFAMKALDTTRRPTPRVLGIAVGDHVEELLARCVSVDPQERPRDAGEMWGMLKNAMAKDGHALEGPYAHGAPDTVRSPPPATQRIPETVPESLSPAIELGRLRAAPRPAAGTPALAATVRMPASNTSGTLALSATPARSPSIPVSSNPATVIIRASIPHDVLVGQDASEPPPPTQRVFPHVVVAPSIPDSTPLPVEVVHAKSYLWLFVVMVVAGIVAAAVWFFLHNQGHTALTATVTGWC